ARLLTSRPAVSPASGRRVPADCLRERHPDSGDENERHVEPYADEELLQRPQYPGGEEAECVQALEPDQADADDSPSGQRRRRVRGEVGPLPELQGIAIPELAVQQDQDGQSEAELEAMPADQAVGRAPYQQPNG